MATIIVEDGSGMTNSNSYVSEAELSSYAADRGITVTGDADDLLIKAMDYLESQSFIGFKETKDQALQWPRANAYIDGYLVNYNEIPYELKKSQFEIALSIDVGVDPQANVARTQKRVKVGELEVEYADDSASTTIVKKISNSLKKLVVGSITGTGFPVDRG